MVSNLLATSAGKSKIMTFYFSPSQDILLKKNEVRKWERSVSAGEERESVKQS